MIVQKLAKKKPKLAQQKRSKHVCILEGGTTSRGLQGSPAFCARICPRRIWTKKCAARVHKLEAAAQFIFINRLLSTTTPDY